MIILKIHTTTKRNSSQAIHIKITLSYQFSGARFGIAPFLAFTSDDFLSKFSN